MDRDFDYTQKILVAVDIGDAPRPLAGMPATHSVYKRLSIPEVEQAFDETHSLFVQLFAGRKFRHVLEQHMGYWEQRIPAGKQCFVHYAIGTDEVITEAFHRLKETPGGLTLLGIYHVEPQSSAYPFGFPTSPTPSHWSLGKTYSYTDESVFWFNFFPQQPYLFEKTFAIWAMFQTQLLDGRGECNQLVAWEGKERLTVQGVSDFAQINLNRFTSVAGYFQSAHEAGKHSFTEDPDYLWYGMLMRKI